VDSPLRKTWGINVEEAPETGSDALYISDMSVQLREVLRSR